MTTDVLDLPTLVLNRQWQPVHVIAVARSLMLRWNDAARVVDPGPMPARGTARPSRPACGCAAGRGTSLASRPRSVTDSHTTLRRSGTRFNSWRGHPFS